MHLSKAVCESVFQILFCNCEALHLFESLFLSLPFHPSLVQCLVFLLDSLDLSFNFLLPLISFLLEPLVASILEIPDGIQLGFFFDLKKGLFHCFREKYIEYGLNFAVIVEQIIILDLSDLVHSSFLRDIWWGRWSRFKFISLSLAIDEVSRVLSLLSQVLSQVYFYPSRWARSQIIWRDLVLGLLELYKLVFDHFKLKTLSFCLDAEFISLSRGQGIIWLQNVHAVCVSPENPLIMHDIQSCPGIKHLRGGRAPIVYMCVTLAAGIFFA